MEIFYLVWEPESGYTKYRQDSITLAKQEAERLAQKEPGKEFYVLKALTMSKTKRPVETIELNDLPF